MIGGSLARRYVQPLFEVADEKDILDKVSEDLETMDSVFGESPELYSFLCDPSVERRSKRGVIESIFSDFSPYMMNFIRVVIDKNRTEVLTVARRMYKAMIDAKRGVINGVVYSAVPIDKDTFTKLKSGLEAQFESKMNLTGEVVPDILGGLRVQIGNTVIDSSVKGHLEKLREILTGA